MSLYSYRNVDLDIILSLNWNGTNHRRSAWFHKCGSQILSLRNGALGIKKNAILSFAYGVFAQEFAEYRAFMT